MTYTVWKASGERRPVGKILCVGRNYAAHVDEMGDPEGRDMVVFLKPPTAIVHDGDTVRIVPGIGAVHHEVELAATIGDRLRHATPDEALDAVDGYAVFLDMTARDMQRRAKEDRAPWDVSKGMDTFAPISDVVPWSEVPDPQDLTLRCLKNGDVTQESSTSLMLVPVAEQIATISRYMTLLPGDVIATGTPEGVGPVEPGDIVRAEIPGVGHVEVEVALDEDARDEG